MASRPLVQRVWCFCRLVAQHKAHCLFAWNVSINIFKFTYSKPGPWLFTGTWRNMSIEIVPTSSESQANYSGAGMTFRHITEKHLNVWYRYLILRLEEEQCCVLAAQVTSCCVCNWSLKLGREMGLCKVYRPAQIRALSDQIVPSACYVRTLGPVDDAAISLVRKCCMSYLSSWMTSVHSVTKKIVVSECLERSETCTQKLCLYLSYRESWRNYLEYFFAECVQYRILISFRSKQPPSHPALSP